MAGKICVYVRDVKHPADLYDTTGHWFAVSVHEVGSNAPLIWKGTNFNWIWLPFTGEFNRVAGEFEVPAGTYLVRGYAFCYNVVTNIAWVQVGDGEIVPVNLVPASVAMCVWLAHIGAALGTIKVDNKEVPVTQFAAAEAAAFKKAAIALQAKLPIEMGLPMMSAEEIQKRLRDIPKEK